ncbi:hypothetical protein QUF70_17865 [Desulfobacterales bacterium HSG17]|nr:hypothetical protein [Desulfobacterales bacterium HSG17]
MKKYDSSKGSILIILILTITIMSVLGAAMLSITTTSLYSKHNFYNYNKATYYADSGIRYGNLIDNFDIDNYFSVFETDTGLEVVQDKPFDSPPIMEKITTAGFHIGITDCNFESTGVVNEDGIFEATRTISSTRGLPCWKFNSLPDTLVDSCGNNSGIKDGTGTISFAPSPYGIVDEAWHFDGSSYVKTLFMPYCEIGDGVSFSISFWVKPENDSEQQTIFGVSGLDIDGNPSSLTLGISSPSIKWKWAYGDKNGITSSQAQLNQWRHIIIVFENDISPKKVHYKIQDCFGFEDTNKNIPNNGTAKLPYSNQYLYIGAENIDGSPGSYFTGEIDELEIKKYEAGIDDIDALITALSPTCP